MKKPRGISLATGIALVIAAFTAAPLFSFVTDALAVSSGWGAASVFAQSSTWASIRFSLVQASLSAMLAVAIGLPGAWIVARYRFAGRSFFLSLAAVPFCLPPILVILGFILYYGKEGWFTKALSLMGLRSIFEGGTLYSLWGLIFIHAFYNFPVVIQNVGAVWSKLPRSREESARTLGASRIQAFRVGTLPYLIPTIMQSASLVFLFCFFSFTIVLVFGGLVGSTLEVGIYRAIRFLGDKPKALALGLVQTVVAVSVLTVFRVFERKSSVVARGFGVTPHRRKPGILPSALIILYALSIAIFFLGPLASLCIEAFSVRDSIAGIPRFGFDNFSRLMGGKKPPLPGAIKNSLFLSGTAAIAATLVGLSLSAAIHYRRHSKHTDKARLDSPGDWLSILPLALSPAIIAAGWTSLLIAGEAPLVILGQTAIAWPFVARSLSAAFSALDTSKHEAARTLGASRWRSLIDIDAGAIAPSLFSAAAFAFSITMGDANIPIVLGGGQYETLPLLLYRLVSSYRFSEACAVGMVLAFFTSLAFFVKEKSNDTA